jgi:hypothetical protein
VAARQRATGGNLVANGGIGIVGADHGASRGHPGKPGVTYSNVQFIVCRIYTGPGYNPDRYVGLSDEAADVR